ncbi:MAG: hypothetical protein ABI470_04725, partial [Aquihabitans sp.]
MPQPLPQFIATRQPGWQDVDALVTTARGRIGRLDADQVRALGQGYRQVVADLAVARRRFPGDPVVGRLDGLVRRVRPLVYANSGERTSAIDFLTTGYWRRVRERPRFLLVAALVLFGPALAVGGWAN